ncbi:MAG: hypothetical protein JNM43_26400 [Planctomycetaceae bacterium]|nr:hypothetical protein [Planctomycetaceae bacterium]
MQRNHVPFIGIIAACTITGCAELSATNRVAGVASVSDARFAEAERFHTTGSPMQAPIAVTNNLPTDLQSLRPGQQVRIAICVSSPEEMALGNVSDVTQYVGTVESIDESRVVLSDASILTEQATGVPVVSKVPYLSRLYKNTRSIAAAPLPHGVVLPKRQIISVQPNIDAPYERIGVDFDFSGH